MVGGVCIVFFDDAVASAPHEKIRAQLALRSSGILLCIQLPPVRPHLPIDSGGLTPASGVSTAQLADVIAR